MFFSKAVLVPKLGRSKKYERAEEPRRACHVVAACSITNSQSRKVVGEREREHVLLLLLLLLRTSLSSLSRALLCGGGCGTRYTKRPPCDLRISQHGIVPQRACEEPLGEKTWDLGDAVRALAPTKCSSSLSAENDSRSSLSRAHTRT